MLSANFKKAVRIVNPTERKKQILRAVVEEYIHTAEPVGSAALMKQYLPKVSSATIRNDMADLERSGYLFQPHTSAGRVPAQKGYRAYLDWLIERQRPAAEDMITLQNALQQGEPQWERMIRKVTEVLAGLTGYAAVSASPRLSKSKIRQIQLIRLDGWNLVLIVFADHDVVKHHHIRLEFPIDQKLAEQTSLMLNREFANLRMEQLDEQSFIRMMCLFEENPELIAKVLRLIVKAVEEMTEISLHLYGVSNLFTYPEFSDIERAKELYDFLDDSSKLRRLFSAAGEQAGTQVLVGTEIGMEEMEDCSLVLARYLPERTVSGMIGLIGPTRMDYSRSMGLMEYIIKHLDRMICKTVNAEDNQLILRSGGSFFRPFIRSDEIDG